MRLEERHSMGIWSPDVWSPSLFYDFGGQNDQMDDSLSSQMEKLSVVKHLWETPLSAAKTIGERICQQCHQFTSSKDVFFQQRVTIQRKLQAWAYSIDIAITGYYKLLERALSYDNSSAKQSTLQTPNLQLISHGYVPKVPLASRSSIRFDDLDTLQNVVRSVTLQIRDYEGKPCNLIDRHAELRAVLLFADGNETDASTVTSTEVGEYELRFRAPTPGVTTLSVKLHGMDVAGSPVKFIVYPEKDWCEPFIPTFFGKEGAGPKEFARPWGIGCDRLGRILIADRSNNRVQVLRDDGMFLFSFGQKGSAPGEFQLVTGVAGSRNGDIVCVDKDNHRLQIFDEDGRFKMAIGAFGEGQGQFHYPWDCDVNSRGDIVVTDSRNGRIQLFDARGNFLSSFGRSDDCKDLDSPRGVSFICTDTVVVSDFNNHKLFVINLKSRKFTTIGREGTGPGELKRPQGVAWHPQGFIVVSDSRNNRIQAFGLNGRVMWEAGSPDLQLDRPCGVAVLHKGVVVAVDFGNHRYFALE